MGVHRFPHQAFRHFRAPKDAKKWLSDNYKLLHLNGIIEDWLTEYPDIASKIEEAGLRGQSIKKVKNQEWQIFCNGYALNGFLPSGIHPRMGDNYMCIAVANIYIAIVNVHLGWEAPVRFTPYTDGTYCTINLVQYCAPNWKHFRSTRPMSSPPASPGPASADLELAEAWPAGVVSSGRTGAESCGGLQEILLMHDGPASQLSQDSKGIELHQQVQQHNHQQHQHPMRSEQLVILDENLLHSPFGSTDPCGAEVTESSTNQLHHHQILSFAECRDQRLPSPD